ncbi:arginase [Faecalimonas sp.]
MLHIFGCPMHCGVGEEGLIHSLDYLNTHNTDLHLTTIPEVSVSEENSAHLKRFNSVLENCTAIAEYSYKNILSKGNTPLFIGGDHSAAIGTVSATATQYDNIGLIWIDAHADINTDLTSASGNIHGMPVSALLNNLSPAGEKLSKILTDNPKVKPEHVVHIGLRDIDPPEEIILKELNIKYFTYDDIKEKGLETCLNEAIDYLSHLEHIHLSFDIDAVNPQLLPGVSVPVNDGFTIPEIYHVFERLLEELPISALDIMEYNKEYDKDDVTADFVSELIAFIQKHVN